MSTYLFPQTKIKGIATAVPSIIKTFNLAGAGVKQLHIASPEQTASDLGFVAAKHLLEKYQINKDDIACIIFASLTPDYRSPATAAVLQYRLGIPVDCIAYDLVLGGTGLVSGMQKAASILESTNKQYALVIAADTNSKLMNEDHSAAGCLGDAGSAVLLEKYEHADPIHLQLYTFSNQWETFSHKAGGFRVTEVLLNEGDKLHANKAVLNHLELNQEGFEETFNNQILKSFIDFLKFNNLSKDQFDRILIQPLSIESLSSASAQLNIPAEDMIRVFELYGNTSASAIPLYLTIKPHKNETGSSKILGLAFGEGLSMGIITFTVSQEAILPLIITDEVFVEGEVSHIF